MKEEPLLSNLIELPTKRSKWKFFVTMDSKATWLVLYNCPAPDTFDACSAERGMLCKKYTCSNQLEGLCQFSFDGFFGGYFF